MLRTIVLVSLLAAAGLAGSANAFDVTFTVIDGTETFVDIQFKGSMTDWNLVPMDDADGDHTWTVTIDVPAGAHEWGAIENDGSEWGIWLIEGPNLQLTVDAEGSVEGQTSYEIMPLAPIVDVTFGVDMSAEVVSADGVHIAGSFGAAGYPEWSPDAPSLELLDGDGDGIYEITLALEQGSSVLYLYINGITYVDSESVPAECGVDNGYGGYNRELVVPDDAGEDFGVGFVFGGCESVVASDETSLSAVKELFR